VWCRRRPLPNVVSEGKAAEAHFGHKMFHGRGHRRTHETSRQHDKPERGNKHRCHASAGKQEIEGIAQEEKSQAACDQDLRPHLSETQAGIAMQATLKAPTMVAICIAVTWCTFTNDVRYVGTKATTR
jgi:hypothetical protein